jgi:hypothetical protein
MMIITIQGIVAFATIHQKFHPLFLKPPLNISSKFSNHSQLWRINYFHLHATLGLHTLLAMKYAIYNTTMYSNSTSFHREDGDQDHTCHMI